MTNLTLANRIWPQASSRALRNVVLAVAGKPCRWPFAAQVSVPMQPVPLTLQTLAVLAIGAAYGAPPRCAATLALYVLEGAVGLPVFAEMKSGLATIMGPTGGYLLGFILAAALVGWLAERGFDRSVPKMLICHARRCRCALLCRACSGWVSTPVQLKPLSFTASCPSCSAT